MNERKMMYLILFCNFLLPSFGEEIVLQTREEGNSSIDKRKRRLGLSIEAANTRNLELGSGTVNVTSFPECIDLFLNPDQCKDFIENVLEQGDGHEVGDVDVKIQVPRDPEELDGSYWMVEVPTTIKGTVACDRNDAETFYPFKWRDGSTGSDLTVENVDCLRLTAGQCCVKIRNYGKTLTSTGYDANDNCLSCFAYREPLVPVVNKFLQCTEYQEFLMFPNDAVGGEEVCSLLQLSTDDVAIFDSETDFRNFVAKDLLDTFINASPRTCDNFDELLEALYDAAIVYPPLPLKIGKLACSICYGGVNDKELDDPSVSKMLEDIQAILNQEVPSSLENLIIIYSNPEGDVATVPTLGGSRSDITDPPGGVIGRCQCTSNQICVEDPDTNEFECQDKSCDEDPSVCDDDEVCDFGNDGPFCRPKRCDEDPTICNENEVCDLLPTDIDYYYTYQCRPKSCREDPDLACEPDEFCVKSEISERVWECEINPCTLEPPVCPPFEFCEVIFPEFGVDFECKDLPPYYPYYPEDPDS